MPKSNLCQLGRGLQHGLQLAAWWYIKLLHARTACGPILPARGSPRNSLERRVVTASWRCGTGFRTMDDDGRSSSAHMCVCVYQYVRYIKYYIIEGSLEVKLPTMWTDEKQRWEESERRED